MMHADAHGRRQRRTANIGTTRFARNRGRDRAVTRLLHKQQWRVLRLWDHELKNPNKCAKRIICACHAADHKTQNY